MKVDAGMAPSAIPVWLDSCLLGCFTQAVLDKIKAAAHGVARLIKSEAKDATESAQKARVELAALQDRYLAKDKAAGDAQSVEYAPSSSHVYHTIMDVCMYHVCIG